MNRTVVLTAALAGALGVGIGFAAVAEGPEPGAEKPPRGPHLERLMSLDLDGDGAITSAEVETARAAAFAEADADGDGALTSDEMKAFGEARHEERRTRRHDRRFQSIDSDGDGVLSEAEFAAGAPPIFDRADTNTDGVLSAEEIEAIGEGRHGRRHKRSDD
ncbi:MAG: EF-hand domain-containing protein [Pseudomonadota bacterium]